MAHDLPQARWPGADEALMSRLFSPVRVGAFTARTRTWVPAMVPWRSTEEGDATPEVVDWYGRFADGRPGVLVVEATGIRDVPSGPLLRIGSDRFVPGLRRLVEEVRERSAGETRLLVQLIDFLSIRRQPTASVSWGASWRSGPSRARWVSRPALPRTACARRSSPSTRTGCAAR